MPLFNTVVPTTRLRISAFLDQDFTRPLPTRPNTMSVAYDPKSFSIKQEKNEYGSKEGPAIKPRNPSFYASGSRVLSVSLSFVAIDLGPYGSKTAQELKPDLQREVDLFERLCQRVNSSTHQPSFLRLNYGLPGLRSTFEARLKEYDITYSLFDQNGRALLAEITAQFLEAVPPTKRDARNRLSSPDLSHRHLVLAGETLPMLCLRYYGSTEPYLQVAAFNQLDDIRSLTPGVELLFPPLENAGVPG
jgi:hypothetical protein